MKKSVLLISCVLLASLFAMSFVSAIDYGEAISLQENSQEKFLSINSDSGTKVEEGLNANRDWARTYESFSIRNDGAHRLDGSVKYGEVINLVSIKNNKALRFLGGGNNWIHGSGTKGSGGEGGTELKVEILSTTGKTGNVECGDLVYFLESEEDSRLVWGKRFIDIQYDNTEQNSVRFQTNSQNDFYIYDSSGDCEPEETPSTDDCNTEGCPDGQECNAETGECYTPDDGVEPECSIDDDDCGDEEICDDDLGVCVSEPPAPVECDEDDEECKNSQKIMRLTDRVNAHGEEWDKDGAIIIYYSKFFQKIYEGGEDDVHACKPDDSNVVVKLDSLTQGHAYDPASEDEDLKNICYGDLSCKLVETSVGCDSGSEPLLSLSASANAHLASGRINGYDYKICCSSENAADIETSCGDGETLCTREDGTTYCDVTCEDGEFSCNDDSECDDNENCMCADCHGVQDSCNEGLVCSYEDNVCRECLEGYGFEVVDSVGQCTPDPGFDVEIISPSEGFNVAVGQEIEFEAEIISMQKDASITWEFGDGQIFNAEDCMTEGECVENCDFADEDNECKAIYSYDEPGAYVVEVKAEEQGGFGSDKEYVNVYVHGEGINVFATITEPSPLEIIDGRDEVFFNASATYVSNCKLDSDECSDLSDSEGGSDCYEVYDGALYCYDLSKEKIGDMEGGYELLFEWVFDEGKAYETTLSGIWSEEFDKAVEFNRSFFTLGLHTADLRVTYGHYIEDECDGLWYYDEDEEKCVEGACDVDEDVGTYGSKDECEASLDEVDCGDYGDVDDDGDVTEDDADLILQYSVDLITEDELNLDNADVNDDGAFDHTDARMILQYVEGLRDTFPVCDSESDEIEIEYCMDLSELLKDSWQECSEDDNYDLSVDFNEDGCVELEDFNILVNNFDDEDWCASKLEESA